MGAEAVIWLIFVAIWFISSIVKQIKQVADQRPGRDAEESRDPSRSGRQRARPDRQPAEDDPMIQLLRQLGGEVEVRPQDPPRETRESRQPPRQSAQQPVPSRPEPRQTQPPPPPPARPARATIRQTTIDAPTPKVAEIAAIPEMDLQPMAKVGQAVSSSAGGSAMARSLKRQLSRPRSARKAILLQEILGKPPGLQGMRGR